MATQKLYNDYLTNYNDNLTYYGLAPVEQSVVTSGSVSNVVKKSRIVQPQFTRMRHSYRSPLSSEKINLEANQFSFDIYNLYQKSNIVEGKIGVANKALFSNGLSLDAIGIEISWSVSDFQLGINQIASRLEKMNQRLEVLQKGLE